MSRDKAKRVPLPDPLFNSTTVAKFINHVMKKGKKTVAEKIVYDAFNIIKEKTKKEPLEVFELAMKNVRPLIEVQPKRVGGATYQIPRPVSMERGTILATRWVLNAARNRKGKPMKIKLAEELMEAAENKGSAIKKREDTHRMAEANRAFAHFSW